jgi:hypothetical protein
MERSFDPRLEIIRIEAVQSHRKLMHGFFETPQWKEWERLLRALRAQTLELLATEKDPNLPELRATASLLQRFIMASAGDPKTDRDIELRLEGLRKQVQELQDADLLPKEG